MTQSVFRVGAGVLGVLWCSSLALPGQSPAIPVDYAAHVRPILAARCLSCHGEQKRSGGLSLASYDAALDGGRSGLAVRPGRSADSLLVHRITGEIEPQMPFEEEPLSPAEIAVLRAWIDQGARETPSSPPARLRWEAPLTLERPAVSAPVWSGWDVAVDRFVSASLAHHRVERPEEVPAAVFARRAYLDLHGLLPTPEQLQAFLDDRSAAKREKLVAALLADEDRYAEHWITFWNDLLRNDEGVNYHPENATRKSITEWLLASLKSNRPYDQYVSKLLSPASAGDPEGFLVGVNWRGDINASQTPAMQAAQNSAQIFLGLNLKCNSCHDSFISRWKLRDAYSLAAYFAPDAKLEMFRCDAATGRTAEPRFLFPQLDRAPPSATLADRRATIASIFTDPRNGRLSRTLVNRVWRRLFGRGIVEPPDEMDAEPWSPELLDWLASDFVEHRYDLKHLIATVMSSRAYRMPAVARRSAPERPRDFVFRGPEVRRLTAEQFADAVGAITGEWRVRQVAAPAAPGGDAAAAAMYTREWRVAASPLTRALGRPIRDQVISVRSEEAAPLQALELVNGEALAQWLSRGALKMLGQARPAPASVFDRAIGGGGKGAAPASFDLDISKADRLWLVVQDTGSYAPELVEAVWAGAELVAPGGATALSSLKPVDPSGLRAAAGPVDIEGYSGKGVKVKTPSRVVYDISGMRFTRFRGTVALERRSFRQDIAPRVRFFVFQAQPDMDRLVPVGPLAPVASGPALRTVPDVTDRVFRHALGRAPSGRERAIAAQVLRGESSQRSRTTLASAPSAARQGRVSAAGLADLLWAVLMTPEFQLIH